MYYSEQIERQQKGGKYEEEGEAAGRGKLSNSREPSSVPAVVG